MLPWLGKTLVLFGVVLTLVGLFLLFFPQISQLPLLKNLGRLPGDIAIKRENFQFFFPLTTSLLISLILTLLLYLFQGWRR